MEEEKLNTNKQEENTSKEEEKKLKQQKKIYSIRKETTFKKIERETARVIIKTFYKIVFRVKTKNMENVPQNEPVIFCANHLNIFDAVALVLFTNRPVRFIAKYEIFENKFANWLLHLYDAIPIRRGMRDLESMKICMKALKQGDSLGIFPEGTRRGIEKGSKVKNGAAFMAVKTNTKVVPVGIQGSFKPFSRVTLNYGKPLDFSKYDSEYPEKDKLELATKEIMDNIIMLTKN